MQNQYNGTILSSSENNPINSLAVDRSFETALPYLFTSSIKKHISVGSAIISGMADMNISDVVSATSRVLQAACSGYGRKQFFTEINARYEKGRLKSNFIDDVRSFGFRSFLDILSFIDSREVNDQEKLEAIKALFFKIVETNTANEEASLYYHLFEITKKMSSQQILIIAGCYSIYKEHKGPIVGYDAWATEVANKVFRGIRPLVEMHEGELESLKLISKRTGAARELDGPFIQDSSTCRLTDSGLRLGEVFNTEN